MKTKESRFPSRGEMAAPERSLPVLKGALAGGGQLPNFIGVLGGSPATLRADARFRLVPRHGVLRWLPLGAPPWCPLLGDPAADRPRGGRAPGQRLRALHAAAHGARG